MLQRMSSKKGIAIWMAVLITLVAGASIHQAWSYFTTYATAEGGYTIHLGDVTEVTEEFSDWTKHITIANTEGQPVFVRARAYTGSKYALSYSDESGKWTPDADGWYYYSDPVSVGESADELLVQISNIPEDDTDSFNVIVVYESTQVLYDSAGEPYADWTTVVNTGTTEGGR